MKHNRTIMRALAVLIAALLFGDLTAKAEKRPWVKIENNVMTFLYGEKDALAENEYELNEGENSPAWSGEAQKITKVTFDASFKDARPTSCYEWFLYFENITSIGGMENLNTSEVTTMRSMFSNCNNLVSLDLSHFDTRKVTDMSFMFSLCKGSGSLDLSSFDTQNVTNMLMMFFGSDVQYIFVSDKFTTAKVTDGRDMFYECDLLSGAIRYNSGHKDYTYANTTNGYFTDVRLKDDVKYYWEKYADKTITFYYGKKKSIGDNESYLKIMDGGWVPNQDEVITAVIDESLREAKQPFCFRWFERFKNLTEIKGLENLNTAEMTSMSMMFYDCRNLRKLDLSNFNTSKVVSMSDMFMNCLALQEVNLSSFDTSNVEHMGGMFSSCYSLANIDLSSFNTSKVTNMDGMFRWCPSLKYIFVGNGFKTDKVTSSKRMFVDCLSLTGAIDFQDEKTDIVYANTETGYFTDVKLKDQAKYGWTKVDGKTMTFYYGKKDKLDYGEMYLTVNYRVVTDDMPQVTKAVFDESFKEARPVSCLGWFFQFENLTDIEGWENVNTEKSIEFDYMFDGCMKLKSVDLSGINTENASTMSYLFRNCTNLKAVYLGDKFNTSNVTEADDMFTGCAATFHCPANSYAEISASKIMEGRDFMAYADINPSAEYGTLCVPQGSNLEADTYEGFDKLYTVSKVDAANGQAILKEEKQLQPGMAYVYHRSLPDNYFKAAIAYKPNAAAANEPMTDGLLRGTFLGTTAPANSYVLNDDAQFHLAAADGTTAVDANQAYIQMEDATALPSTLSLKIDDASGIKGIIDESEAAGNGRVYDLMGRQVDTIVKGRVYIKDGKKMMR